MVDSVWGIGMWWRHWAIGQTARVGRVCASTASRPSTVNPSGAIITTTSQWDTTDWYGTTKIDRCWHLHRWKVQIMQLSVEGRGWGSDRWGDGTRWRRQWRDMLQMVRVDDGGHWVHYCGRVWLLLLVWIICRVDWRCIHIFLCRQGGQNGEKNKSIN